MIELRHAAGRTPIRVGPGLLGAPASWQEALTGQVLVVSDKTVAALYLDRLMPALAGHRVHPLILPPGEESKTPANWQQIIQSLADCGAGRDATVIALGGGVIGDLAGFAAACYMRGVGLVQAPTTLLAQVDAAIGGKTGVNLGAGKNLVGAFYQPRAVIADTDTLLTLDDRDVHAGLAEVVKYGAIRDPALFAWLEEYAPALQRRQPESLAEAVRRSIANKVAVVEGDEREAGARALLNFGHSFGHALETVTGYRRFRHGEAVAIGMSLAATLSTRVCGLRADEAERLIALLRQLSLPVTVPDGIAPAALLKAMRLDKKNRDGGIRLIGLEAIGRARVIENLPVEQISGLLGQ